MKLNSNIQICLLCLLIMGAGVASNGNKKTAWADLMADTANGLMQVKSVKAGTVCIQVMPPVFQDDVYRIRISLKSNQAVNQSGSMQYMNFNIKNSFYTIQGGDTMTCMVCERVPGIGKNEFVYMTCFNKTAIKNDTPKNLRLYIADTIAGFGIAVFEIKKQSLEKMEAIKQ